MPNIYKPRYKICYQTKNKVWIYKNSRLRNFYNIRNRVILTRQRQKVENTIVTRNMKWTEARRLMVPYVKTRSYFSYNYKNNFYLKQQLKNFYGKLKEHHLRMIFKNTWNKEQYFRRDIFISSLEQRLDMVLFRSRLLPTIFSCHQFIDHQGVLVNNKLITIPGYRIKVGDIVSLQPQNWTIFYNRIFYKLKKRFFGNILLTWRKQDILTSIQDLIYFKYKNSYKQIVKQIFFHKKLYKIYQLYLNDKLKNKELNNNFLIYLKEIIVNRIYFQLKQITIKRIRKLTRKKFTQDFYKNYHFILYKNYNISKLFYTLIFILEHQNQLRRFNLIKSIIQSSKNNKSKKNKLLLYFLILNNKKLNKNYSLYNTKQYYLTTNFKIWLKKICYQFLNQKYNANISNKLVKNKAILFNVNKLKNQERRQERFQNKSFKPHWYIPNYLEIDYKTLRIAFITYPTVENVYYGFPCSFDSIISFYKERAF